MSDALISQTGLPLLCDHVLDESEDYYRRLGGVRRHDRRNFEAGELRAGDIVFVKTDLLKDFCRRLTEISVPITLVTGVSDKVPAKFRFLLHDKRIVSWAGTNMPEWSPKVLQLPIGFAAAEWAHGDTEALREMAGGLPWHERPVDILVTAMGNTSAERRSIAIPGAHVVRERLDYRAYLQGLGEAKFVACPPGNGPDTHRFWEALAMGAVPIVRRGMLDTLYRSHGALIVDDWPAAAVEAERFAKGEALRVANLVAFQNAEGPLFQAYWRTRLAAHSEARLRIAQRLPPRAMMNLANAGRRLVARASRMLSRPEDVSGLTTVRRIEKAERGRRTAG